MALNFTNIPINPNVKIVDNTADFLANKKPLVLIDFFRRSQNSAGVIEVKGMKNLIFVVEYINVGVARGLLPGTWELKIFYTPADNSVKTLTFNITAPKVYEGQSDHLLETQTIFYDNRVFLTVNSNETLTITGVLKGSPNSSKNIFASGSIYRIEQ